MKKILIAIAHLCQRAVIFSEEELNSDSYNFLQLNWGISYLKIQNISASPFIHKSWSLINAMLRFNRLKKFDQQISARFNIYNDMVGEAFKYLLILLSLIASIKAFGQSNTPIFIGIQPNVTIEPFYEQGELDVDILPLVIEASIGLRTNLKITPIVNYHIGGETAGVSDIGVFTVLPIFFRKKEIRSERPYGFYVGPVLGFGRNFINDHYTTTLAVEPGYMFKTKKRFTIAIGLQLGGSYFSYDDEANKWVTHWGPKVSFGYWIN